MAPLGEATKLRAMSISQRPLYRAFTQQAQIDAQYNPSLALAAGEDPGAHYATQAEAARRLHGVQDLPYGPTVHETLDIFPADQPNAPVFVFLHGGYWRAYHARDFSGVALGLQPLGVTTVVVNYALAPHVAIDEIVRQCRAALAWTVRNIAQYGGDPERIAIGGHSAGGHLTAMCLQTDWERDYNLAPDPFAAALLFSGLYDIAPLRFSYLQPAIQLDDGVVQRNSPAFSVRPCKTPIWITWGERESSEFARQSAVYAAAWRGAGNQARLEAIAEADHFSVIHGLERQDSPVCQWLLGQLQGA